MLRLARLCCHQATPSFHAAGGEIDETGVGHEPQSLPDVRRADARSAQIGGPDGIYQSLQVSSNSGEPLAAIRACNLLAKDHCRAALGDEAVKSGPEVSLVGMAAAQSRARKRLTGA